MKKYFCLLLLAFSTHSYATKKEIVCETHTYGDQIYELRVNLDQREALFIGSDTWYHEDFIVDHLSDLSITVLKEGVSIEHPYFKALLKFHSKTAFASPAIYKRLRLDFDCQ